MGFETVPRAHSQRCTFRRGRQLARLLRARCERQRRRRAAEQRDEIAASQSLELHLVPRQPTAGLQDIELVRISQEVTERFYNLLAVGAGGRCPSRVKTRIAVQRPKPIREFPRLCRGGSKSLTYPEVGSLGPWTGLQTVSRQAHERSPANG
jgi:hypothetical protein